jgi:hypothetical protein
MYINIVNIITKFDVIVWIATLLRHYCDMVEAVRFSLTYADSEATIRKPMPADFVRPHFLIAICLHLCPVSAIVVNLLILSCILFN